MAMRGHRFLPLVVLVTSAVLHLSACDLPAGSDATPTATVADNKVAMALIPQILREGDAISCIRVEGMSLQEIVQFRGDDCHRMIEEFITMLSHSSNSPYEWPEGADEYDMAAEGHIDFFSECNDKTPLLRCRFYRLAGVVDFVEGSKIRISTETANRIERLFSTR